MLDKTKRQKFILIIITERYLNGGINEFKKGYTNLELS
jgi:hypothetical protein